MNTPVWGEAFGELNVIGGTRTYVGFEIGGRTAHLSESEAAELRDALIEWLKDDES